MSHPTLSRPWPSLQGPSLGHLYSKVPALKGTHFNNCPQGESGMVLSSLSLHSVNFCLPSAPGLHIPCFLVSSWLYLGSWFFIIYLTFWLFSVGIKGHFVHPIAIKCIAAAAAKALQSLSDSVRPHRRQPTRLPRPWDSPGKNTGVGCHFLLQCMKVKSESEVAQSCLTLSDPMDCSLPGSSIHGIFQATVLEWGAIAFSHQMHYSHVFKKSSCLCSYVKLTSNLIFLMLTLY